MCGQGIYPPHFTFCDMQAMAMVMMPDFRSMFELCWSVIVAADVSSIASLSLIHI